MIKVLGANFSLGGGAPVIIASMQQKATAVWHANRHVFLAGGKCHEILSLIDTLVRPAAVELGQIMLPSYKRQILSSSDFCEMPNRLNSPEGKRGRVGKRGINVRSAWTE